jgi:hypothetical protein
VGFPARYVAVGAVSMLAVALAWLVYSWPVTVQYFPTYAVTYCRGLWQSFELEVVDEAGRPVHFCASMYGWLPNGSFAEIGKGCGVGRRSFDPKALRQYAEAWRGHEGVEPGVIILLTYLNGTKLDGKPALARTAKSFTIQPDRMANGENVKATIKVKAKPPHNKPSGRQNTELGLLSLSWPLGRITECIPDYQSKTTYCYEWRLDTVYYSMLDTKVPTATARITSTTDANYIDQIDLYFVIVATTSVAAYFRAGAAISYGSTADVATYYSADVYTIVLRNARLRNDTDTHRIGYFEPQGRPGVYVVGFYGDVALVRYREYVVSYPSGFASPTGYVADVYLVRPSAARMQRGVIALFQDVDPTPTDNSGYSQIFNILSSYWSNNTRWGDWKIGVSFVVITNEVKDSSLSIGIPLIRHVSGVSPMLTAATGFSFSDQSGSYITPIALLRAFLRESYRNVLDIEGWYYYPTTWYEIDGEAYRIPSIFMDLYTQPQNAR